MAKTPRSRPFRPAAGAQNSASGPDRGNRPPGNGPEIAQRLQQAVRAAGRNQVVAARSGVPLGTIANYMRGRHGMKIEPLRAIAAACNVSLGWLVDGDAAPAPSQAAPGFAPEPAKAPHALAERPADPSPAASPDGLDLQALAKAIELVAAITADASLQTDAKALARRIANAYAVLVQPPDPA